MTTLGLPEDMVAMRLVVVAVTLPKLRPSCSATLDAILLASSSISERAPTGPFPDVDGRKLSNALW